MGESDARKEIIFHLGAVPCHAYAFTISGFASAPFSLDSHEFFFGVMVCFFFQDHPGFALPQETMMNIYLTTSVLNHDCLIFSLLLHTRAR